MKMNRKHWRGALGRFKNQDHLDAYLHCLHTSQVGDLIEIGCFYLTSSIAMTHSYLTADTDIRVYNGPVVVETYPIVHKEEDVSYFTPKRVSYPCIYIKDMVAWRGNSKLTYVPLLEETFWATRIIKKTIP
jgi:hypothetical protein